MKPIDKPRKYYIPTIVIKCNEIIELHSKIKKYRCTFNGKVASRKPSKQLLEKIIEECTKTIEFKFDNKQYKISTRFERDPYSGYLLYWFTTKIDERKGNINSIKRVLKTINEIR